MAPARFRGWTNAGAPAFGCLLYTYESGTTTPKLTYQDKAGTVPHTNPIVLDAKGEALIYWNGNYRIDLRTAAGVQITGYPVDDYETPLMGSSLGTETASSTINGTWFGGVVAYLSALGTYAGAALVGFIQAGAGALARSIQAKMRETVSPKDFGCVIDGVTDDTVGWWACVAFAMENGYKIVHPGGVLRITSGFTTTANYRNLFITGAGRANEPAPPITSVILLDSADPASFFLKIQHNMSINVTGVAFKCAQYVAERPFFQWGGTCLHWESFTNVGFEAVEQPFVYLPNTYFQNCAFRDIQFRNSGTWHSKALHATGIPNLMGTFMLIDNCHHEGFVPVNAEKIVCNLQGIRAIDAQSFLLEGALPGPGWTILRIACPYDATYTRKHFGRVSTFHSEWSGANTPAYTIDQVGGMFKWDYLYGTSVVSKYKLSGSGKAIVESSVYSQFSGEEATTHFELEDSTCIVQFDSCSARGLDLTKAGFIQNNMQQAAAVDGQGQIVLSNSMAQEIWRWNGAIMDGDQALYQMFGGTTSVYSTDSAYGRKLVLTPNAGALDARITLKTGSMLVPGDQLVICARAKLPTFAAGLWAFTLVAGGTTLSTKYFDSTYSGAYVDVLMPIVLLTTPTTIAFGFGHGTTSGVATPLEILSVAMYHGNSVPRRQVPSYPENTVSWSSAAPTTGTWKRGDIVWNDAPTAAGIPGWVCTTAGTPGTWKAMAVLAA